MGRTAVSSGLGLLLFIAVAGSRCNEEHGPAILAAAAEPSPPRAAYVASAAELTARYGTSYLGAWHVRGHAAGADCNVLVVETSVVLEESQVEALHYGSGAYDVVPGGVQQFARDHHFRGVIYNVCTGGVWHYGVGNLEASRLQACQ